MDPNPAPPAPAVDERLSRLGWGIALALYLATRLPLLGYFGLDLDETTSARLAQTGISGLLGPDRLSDIHPPLFYLLLWPLRLISADEQVLRLLPLAAGWGICWGAAAIAERIGGRRAAIWTLALGIGMPYSIRYSVYLRPAILGACMSTWMVYAALRWWAEAGEEPAGRPRYPWLVLLFAVLAVYSFYPTGVVLIAVFVTCFLLMWRERRVMVPWLLTGLACAIAFAPWIPTILAQRASWITRLPEAPQAGASQALWFSQPFIVELSRQTLSPWYTFDADTSLWFLLMASLAASIAARRQGRAAGLMATGLIVLTAIAGVLYDALSRVSPYPIQGRYLIPVVALCWPLLGAGTAAAGRWLGPIFLGLFLVIGSYSTARWLTVPGEDFRGAGRYLSAEVPPDAPVFVIAHFSAIGLAHYWPEGETQMVPIKQYATDSEVSRVKIEQALAANESREVWLAVSRDHSGRWWKLNRGGNLLALHLEERFGRPQVVWFQGVTLFRWRLRESVASP